jgi:hypothetical protein
MGLVMGRKSVLCGPIWIFSILIMMVISNVPSLYASPLTEVTLKLQEEPPKVDVSPGSSGIVTAQGTVTCEKWGPDQVKVSLTGNSTFGGANVNPPNIVFGGASGSEETRSFSVTTRVPPGTPCTEKGELFVAGIFTQGGMQDDIDSVAIKIIILQFYQISVENEKGKIQNMNYTSKAGDTIQVDFYLRNEGNGNDVFNIDFGNRENMQKRDFELPVIKEIGINPNVRENVFLDIGIPKDTTGTFETQVVITSKGSEKEGSSVTYILPVTLKVEEVSIPDKILSFILSPLIIGIVIVIVLIVLIYKIKNR